MSEFGFKNLQWELITNSFDQWKLLKPEYYQAKDGTLYMMPAGAGSDLASIPRILWGPPLYLPKCGWYTPAAVLHDLAFRNALMVVNNDGIKIANLAEDKCNLLILEAMQSLRPNPTALEKIQMEAIYQGLAIGGSSSFREDREP